MGYLQRFIRMAEFSNLWFSYFIQPVLVGRHRRVFVAEVPRNPWSLAINDWKKVGQREEGDYRKL